MLFPYLHEACMPPVRGVPLGADDRAAVDLHRMGVDWARPMGLDVIVHVGEIITRELGREMPPYTQRLRELVAARKLGRKAAGDSIAGGRQARAPTRGAAPPEDLPTPDPRSSTSGSGLREQVNG
jgi:3-hydroxyacyl-CoA dehydrogenase